MDEHGRGRGIRDIIVWALLLVLPIGWLIFVLPQSFSSGQQSVPISQIVTGIEQGSVRSLSVQGDTINVQYTDGSTVVTHKEPNETIFDLLRQEGVTAQELKAVSIDIVPQSPLSSILDGPILWIGLGLLVLGGFVLFSRQSSGQSGPDQTLSFLKSRARKIVADRPKVHFDDAEGVDEAKQELREVVEFLKSPAKFAVVGARTPKGVLLIGPPGTGKTLLARAVAGEAGVPFFSISGSEFVELFVGVGASRVRDLFDQAKRNAPCIIFVDEIDAVGRQRGFGIGGGHDEREQTLNQILVEMDGFDKNTNVVVLAATNRPDVLDPALLRPGRFDRRVVLDPPDVAGRRAILRIHSRNKPLAPDVDLERVAAETAGFSGADLENLLNEAAILAARANQRVVSDAEIEEAVDRVLAGPERKTRLITPREKAITAYHEAGHALAAHVLPGCDPVHKVTVIPRGISGGHTRLVPAGDRQLWTKSQLLDLLTYALGGMAAESIVFGETTTGPSNDLEHATDIARRMVCEYGMSEVVGPVQIGRHEGFGSGAREVTDSSISDVTASEVDREVRLLIRTSLTNAKTIFMERRDTLDRIAKMLMSEETLQGERLQRLLSGEVVDELPAPPENDAVPPAASEGRLPPHQAAA